MNHTTERFARFSRHNRSHSQFGDAFEHYKRPSFYTAHKVGVVLLLAIAIIGTLAAIAAVRG